MPEYCAEGNYEGLSILGVSHFIVLEPTDNVSKSQQLDARVVRLNSHEPGQYVQIYKMCSSIDFLARISSTYKNWMKQNLETFWSAVTTFHSRSLTPDYILLQRLENLTKHNSSLQKALSSNSIETIVSKGRYPNSCYFDEEKTVSTYEPLDNYFKSKFSNKKSLTKEKRGKKKSAKRGKNEMNNSNFSNEIVALKRNYGFINT